MAASPASAEAADLSIGLGDDSIGFGDTVSIEGRLGDSAAPGRTVLLYEKPFPYRELRVVARGTTDPDGRYRFRVRPDFNTRYRVTAPGESPVRSKSKLVVVLALGRIDTRATPSGQAKSKVRFVYSPRLGLSYGGRRVFWYFAKVGDPRFVVRDRTRASQPRPGLVKARTSFDLPDGEFRFNVSFCIDDPDRRDIGLGPPGLPRDCPRSFAATSAARTMVRMNGDG